VKSVKWDQILETLTKHYMPFTLLSEERLAEVSSVLRFIQLREGEIFQIRGGVSHDYLYVVEGCLELTHSGVVRTLHGSKDTSKRPYILPHAPESCTILARENSILCHADRDLLDELISWDEMVHFTEDYDTNLHDQLEFIRNSLVFRRMPLFAVEEAFKRMKHKSVKAGDEVVRQGEAGDSFYVIVTGTAEAFQTGLYDDSPKKVAELSMGDTFGSDALISGKARDETVRMTQDGTLLVLGKDDFGELIGKELVKTIPSKVARTMLDHDYGLIDVRYAEEYDEIHIPGSILIPLYELRDRIGELDKAKKYVIYCHSGNRSAIAAMLLAQNSIEALSMEGGIRDWEFEIETFGPNLESACEV